MNLCLVSLDRSTITSKVITASSDWSNIYMIPWIQHIIQYIIRLVQYMIPWIHLGPIVLIYWSNIGQIYDTLDPSLPKLCLQSKLTQPEV